MMLVNENNYDVFEKVHKETLTDYEIKWFNAKNIDGYIDEECLLCMIEDLLYEVEHWKEKYEDLEQDLQDNYRPIPYSEQVGISDRDFI